MSGIIVCNIVGYLVQTVPYAVLCLLPFSLSAVTRPRATISLIAALLAAGLPGFLFIATLPPLDGDGSRDVWMTLQNLYFMALMAGMFAVFAASVHAPLSQKAFVFCLVACFGSFVTMGSAAVQELTGKGTESAYMYPPYQLTVLSFFTAASFGPVAVVARSLGKVFHRLGDDGIWRRLAALPLTLSLCSIVGGWLSRGIVPMERVASALILAVFLFALFMFWWEMRSAHAVAGLSEERERLEAMLANRVREVELLQARLSEVLEGRGEGVGAPAAKASAPAPAASDAPVDR